MWGEKRASHTTRFSIEKGLKIGIGCKKTRRAVEIGDVEAFSTTIERCKLDKGIMVSFTGYQSGAIAEAKMSNIGLYSFRPCGAEDLDGRIEQIDYEYIDEGTRSVHLEFKTRDINVGSIGSLHEVGIYDENGVRIGNLHEVVSGLLEREIFKRVKRQACSGLTGQKGRSTYTRTGTGRSLHLECISLRLNMN